MLGRWGSRCWTSTKAMPVSAGMCWRKFLNASRPPAEAPMPTVKKSGGATDVPRFARLALPLDGFGRGLPRADVRASLLMLHDPMRRPLSQLRLLVPGAAGTAGARTIVHASARRCAVAPRSVRGSDGCLDQAPISRVGQSFRRPAQALVA